MAVRRLADEQPASFAFTPDNLAWARGKIAEYPEGRQASAVIPILWRAQEQNNGWLPEPAIRLVADMLDMPYIRALEIATFYTMFQLKPVGSVAHIGVCGTTPCMLRGSQDVLAVCRERIAPEPFTLSPDGRFSWEEVECAGACVNAPIVQIGPDTYEDLTSERFHSLLDALERGERPQPGPMSARHASEPISGPTTLTSPARDRRPAGSPAEANNGLPETGLDPTAEVNAGQDAGHPAPSRTEVEATRTADAADRESSPVAPEPRTGGQVERAPDDPAKQKAADAPDQRAPRPERGAAGEAGGRQAAERAKASANWPDSATDAGTAAPEDTAAAAPDSAEPAAQEFTARAAPAATTPEPPVSEDEARSAKGDRARSAASARQDEGAGPPPPADGAAAERADAAGTRPPAYSRSQVDEVDELQRISGIGPVLEKTLHDLGIFKFEQIASWSRENTEWVNAYLAFKGRIDRENWVEQARKIVDEKRDES